MISLENIPLDPGCYLYKDKDDRIIYIGKAKCLRKRVKSYFQKNDHDDKTRALVKDIAGVEFFATSSEVEALILESTLIRKHRPKYNIDLKDSRRYAYILLTDEEFPRLTVARDRSAKGKYYGPFVSADLRDHILKLLRSSFRLRTCRKLPKRECLRYHLGLCSAPCIRKISKEDYDAQIRHIEQFLKGDADVLIRKLESDMADFSKRQLYERAKVLRDQIFALKSLREKQNMEKDKRYDEDVINYILDKGHVCLIVFNVSKGILTTKNEFSFDFKDGFLEEFITQYYSSNPVPKEIIIPHAVSDDSIVDYLRGLRKGSCDLVVPKKGDKLDLLNLVKRNIEISFLRGDGMTNDLRDRLRLNANPHVIECFDISHTSGSDIVASMVQFRDGRPDKSNYRRFNIRTVEDNDDFASMREVVKRRYSRLKAEGASLPDLIVVDGGKGQLSAALGVLEELELKIPVISLAKRFEEVYVPGLGFPIRLKKQTPALKLLMQVRNEAHRFAINYHRLLRSKRLLDKEAD
jgi:excinuclease ABC subunit C